MALAMARPWKHPKTGIYWLRKRVPEDLRAAVGKTEERRSLRTRDPGEARKRHPTALAELEARWANLRGGPRSITETEAHQLAIAVYDGWVAMHRHEPSQQRFWRTDLFEKLWAPPKLDITMPFQIDSDLCDARRLQDWCEAEAARFATSLGMVLDGDSSLKLGKAVASAMQRASLALARASQGEPQALTRVTIPSGFSQITSTARPLPFDDLLSRWVSEKRPAPKTEYDWRRVFDQLQAHVGHRDATRLTSADLLGWKASLIAGGRHAKTIRDAKLAPVRAVLQCGVDNGLLSANPAERVTIDVRVRAGEGIRSFTEDEAKLVLAAAAKSKDPVRRWVPWLCAYSGARVSEICQLRAEDIVVIDGVWCMKFDPEAGSLKNAGSERAVPLHPALIESGFLAFAQSVKKGPLFADLPPDKFGKRGGNGTKILGRFVRSLGLADPRLSPNHSWRHRLKTMGRRHGLAPDIVDAITGHRRRTVADSYGEFEMAALDRELRKIPTVPL